jgi:Fe-S-cluster containining protein
VTDALRFGCTACGDCCRRDGVVELSGRERRRAARHLALTVAAFDARFGVEALEQGYQLVARDGRGCPLLAADGRCSIHDVKPKQCATYPFWPELVDEPGAWLEERARCPGIEHPAGRVYPASELVQLRAGRGRT